MRLTPLAKGFITLVILSVVGIVLWTNPGLRSKLAPSKPTQESQVPQMAQLPGSKQVTADKLSGQPGCTDRPEVKLCIPAWNGQMGLIYATGGAQAGQGSLMCRQGVNLRLVREDDTAKAFAAISTFATAFQKGERQPAGCAGMVVMGDSLALHYNNLNTQLRTVCPRCEAKAVAVLGFSAGEDVVMVRPEAQKDPQKLRGSYIAVVPGDGDYNLLVQGAAINNLPVNPNYKVFDPNAINIYAVADYLKAAEAYIASHCEKLPDAKTGEVAQHCVDGVATWTPGDANIAEQRGGLVPWISTRDFPRQMPTTLILYGPWAEANMDLVTGMLVAAFQGNEAVMRSDTALHAAAGFSALVYNEKDGTYWKRYFTRHAETDKTGQQVELGGSSVASWAVANGVMTNGVFEAVYQNFGNIFHKMDPATLPTVPPYSQAVDLRYMDQAGSKLKLLNQAGTPDAPTFSAATPMTRQVGRRSWAIQFQSGKATFDPATYATLDQLRTQAMIATGTIMEVHGHTDSAGSPARNMILSRERAAAVQQYLIGKSNGVLTLAAVRVFAHGSDQPVADNSTAEGRAQNRRVEVVVGAVN